MKVLKWLRDKFSKPKQSATQPEFSGFVTLVDTPPRPTGETVRERRPSAQFSGGTGPVRGRVGGTVRATSSAASRPATKERKAGYVYNEDTGFQTIYTPVWEPSASRSSDSGSSSNCSPPPTSSPDTGSTDSGGSCGGGSTD